MLFKSKMSEFILHDTTIVASTTLKFKTQMRINSWPILMIYLPVSIKLGYFECAQVLNSADVGKRSKHIHLFVKLKGFIDVHQVVMNRAQGQLFSAAKNIINIRCQGICEASASPTAFALTFDWLGG